MLVFATAAAIVAAYKWTLSRDPWRRFDGLAAAFFALGFGAAHHALGF